MAKDLRIILLLDCYGAFLTPRQQEMMTHYYSEDLSLGEIAALTGTTRQAVRDSVKRSEQVLNDMEEKLQFAEKLCALRQNYAAIPRQRKHWQPIVPNLRYSMPVLRFAAVWKRA